MSANHTKLERLHGQLRYELGEAICTALKNPTVTGIKVSEDGKLWLKKHVIGWEDQEIAIPEDRRLRALNIMADLLGRTLDERESRLFGELPLTGDRVQGSRWPSSAPSFIIRIHAPQQFPLGDYVAKGIIREWQAEVLRYHVQKRSNIVTSGATDSGKTTLLNALLLLTHPTEHIYIIEDTREIQCTALNLSRMLTNETNLTMLSQIKASLRWDPDRLIIGETRDAAGFALLKSWITGKRGGMTTVHADCAAHVFDRFAGFCEEAGVPPQWRLMRSAIDLIVHMEMTPAGRRVTEIVEVKKEDESDKMPVQLTRLGPPIAADTPLTNGGKLNGTHSFLVDVDDVT